MIKKNISSSLLKNHFDVITVQLYVFMVHTATL